MKQPRVPEYRNGEDIAKYIHTLILFLKDFCQETWMQGRAQEKAISGILYQVTSVDGETDGETLAAADAAILADEARGEG